MSAREIRLLNFIGIDIQVGAILAELKITPTGVGDIITFSRSIADYPSMYAAIFSIIVLAVLFLNLLEKTESVLFKGNQRGYVSD